MSLQNYFSSKKYSRAEALPPGQLGHEIWFWAPTRPIRANNDGSEFYWLHSLFSPCWSSLQYERVARAYKTGVYAHPGDFCAKSCNSWVKAYNNNFAEKSDEWWESLLNHYDVAESEPEKVGDKSILDETRGALPMSSSPWRYKFIVLQTKLDNCAR